MDGCWCLQYVPPIVYGQQVWLWFQSTRRSCKKFGCHWEVTSSEHVQVTLPIRICWRSWGLHGNLENQQISVAVLMRWRLLWRWAIQCGRWLGGCYAEDIGDHWRNIDVQSFLSHSMSQPQQQHKLLRSQKGVKSQGWFGGKVLVSRNGTICCFVYITEQLSCQLHILATDSTLKSIRNRQ